MLAARLSWVGPSFLSTIRQETPWRFSSAAMNRPAGPAPTTNTWVSVAIRYLTDSSHRDAFAERALRNIGAGACGSLWLDVGGADHLGPFLSLFGHKLCKFCGRACKRYVAEVCKPRRHTRVG